MGVVHYAPPVSGGQMSGIADKIIEAMPKAKTSNEVASDAKFAEAFGKSQKEHLLKTFVCREGQTFNVYWQAVAEAAFYKVEVYKYVSPRWYELTTLEIERQTHYVSIGDLVGDGYVFRVTAEDRSGEMLARSSGVVMRSQTVD